MSTNKEEVKLDVPIVHSPAQLCHMDSLSMILRYIGDGYEPWYLGGASGRFFGFGYFPNKESIRIRLGTFPLEAILTFLKDHGYSFQFNEGKPWGEAFPALKRFLREGMPVLVVCHMGWLSYNKEYEMFRRVGGVVDHYVVVTGFRDEEVVYINDPNPDFFRKDAELPLKDFKIGWAEKLKEIQSMQCPMIAVIRREHKPETKEIIVKALRRAIKRMNTTSGHTGVAGLRMASIDISKLLREGAATIINSIGGYAFFTFRVAATESRYASEFLNYAAEELGIPQIKLSAAKLLIASECFTNLRRLFMNCVQGKAKTVDIADDVETLLNKAYEAEKQCFTGLSQIRLTRNR